MKLRESDDRKRDLRALAQIAPDLLVGVRDCFSNSNNFTFSTAELSSKVGEIIDGDSARVLVRFVLGVRGNLSDDLSDLDEYFDALEEILKSDEDEYLAKWTINAPHLKEIVSSKVAYFVSKCSELYFLNSKHFHSVKIITESRPIFDERASAILGSIIKNDLYMEISDDSEQERLLNVAVGVDDLLALREQIDRALAKTQVLTRLAREQGKPVRVYGGEPEND